MPRAQGQEKVFHVQGTHLLSMPGLPSLVGLLTLCTQAADPTHCTQHHPVQVAYKPSSREPWFQMH